MEGYAHTTILATVGQDPEFRTVGTDKQVATFSVVTNKVFKVNGEKKQDSQWHSIECWGPTATFVRDYVKKGNAVFIVGEPKTEAWEDKEGVKRHKHKVVANIVKFAGNNSNSTEGNGGATSQATQTTQAAPKDGAKKVAAYKGEPEPQGALSNDDFGGGENIDDLPF